MSFSPELNAFHQRSYFVINITFLLLMSNFINCSSIPSFKLLEIADFQQIQPPRSQLIMSYYDINQDEHSDILTISTLNTGKGTIRHLVLYLWNENKEKFTRETAMDLGFQDVKAVVCTQLMDRQNIEVDVLVSYEAVSGQGQNYAIQLLKITCDKEDKKCIFSAGLYLPELQSIDHILPSLIVMDGKVSIIYSKENKAMTFYFNNINQYQIKEIRLSNFIQKQQNSTINKSLGYQLSYFGDYNADGTPDLIIAQKILLNQSDLTDSIIKSTKIHFFKYNLLTMKFIHELTEDLKNTQIFLKTEFQFFTLTDINFDGRIDLLLLFNSGLIQIHYNVIEAPNTLLVLPNGAGRVPFDFDQSSNHNISKIQRIWLPYKVAKDGVLTFGDVNNDGYEDFLVDCLNDKNQQQKCKETCGDKSYNLQFYTLLTIFNRRTFSRLNLWARRLKESTQMFFIDLYKDGKLDLVVHWVEKSTNNKQIQVYFNNGYYDSFFMKVAVVKGKNYEYDYENLLVVGASVSCFVTGLGGNQLPKIGNQLTQVGRVHQSPYVFFGLGRSNNYVNHLTITIPYISVLYSNQFSWTPIIPNSQIIIIANPEGKWQLTTFIQPTKKMGTVVLLVILALAAIGFSICHLSAKEKKEDKENIEVMYTILK